MQESRYLLRKDAVAAPSARSAAWLSASLPRLRYIITKDSRGPCPLGLRDTFLSRYLPSCKTPWGGGKGKGSDCVARYLTLFVPTSTCPSVAPSLSLCPSEVSHEGGRGEPRGIKPSIDIRHQMVNNLTRKWSRIKSTTTFKRLPEKKPTGRARMPMYDESIYANDTATPRLARLATTGITVFFNA